jgi:hypothetical protein
MVIYVLVVVKLYELWPMEHSALPTGGGLVMLPKNISINEPLGAMVAPGSQLERLNKTSTIVYGPAGSIPCQKTQSFKLLAVVLRENYGQHR